MQGDPCPKTHASARFPLRARSSWTPLAHFVRPSPESLDVSHVS